MKNSPFNLDLQNQDIDSKIIIALERVSEAFRVLLWNESKEHSLSPIQVQVLIFLLHHKEEQCKVSYLADEFNMRKSTISDTVKSLELKGLISKESLQEDSRSYIILLTEKGQDIARKTAAFTEEIQSPINKLAAQQKEEVLLALTQTIHHLNKKGIINIQRMCLTCTQYRENHNGGKHYCMLLKQKLENSELRLDCPEHVLSK